MAEQRQKTSIHLVLDFDGTLTMEDTMSVFSKLPKNPALTWEQISEAYMQDYNTHKSAPFPWENYDRPEYSRWLASRKWVEERSAQRVQDAAFFRGVTYDDVNAAADNAVNSGALQLRPGWYELLQVFLPPGPSPNRRSKDRVSILSVNWSEAVIRRALWTAAKSLDNPRSLALAEMINDMEIHANEIQGLGAPEGSAGRVRRLLGVDIRTNEDKLRYFQSACDSGEFTVYVGDSPTDYDCICAADLGVWLHDCDESLYLHKFSTVFSPLRYAPPPLSATAIASQQSDIFWSPSLIQVTQAVRELMNDILK